MRVVVAAVPGLSVTTLPGWVGDVVQLAHDQQDCEGIATCDAAVVSCDIDAASALATALRAAAAAALPILGFAEGFASLCRLGLLPGELRPATTAASGACLRVEGQPTPFTAGLPAGRVLHMPLGHAAAYHCTDRLKLEQSGQVIFRYCDEWAGLSDAANPVGAPAAIAGVCNVDGNVVGLQATLVDQRVASPPMTSGAAQIFASFGLWVAHRKSVGARRTRGPRHR